MHSLLTGIWIALAPPSAAASGGCLDLDPPRGWELTTHRRRRNYELIRFVAPDDMAVITLERGRETARTHDYPLRLVSDVLAHNLGRSRGVEAASLAQHEIELDGRQAWATTVSRRHGPREALASLAVVRTSHHLVMVSLQIEPGMVQEHGREWDRVLQSLRLPCDPPDPERPLWNPGWELEDPQ